MALPHEKVTPHITTPVANMRQPVIQPQLPAVSIQHALPTPILQLQHPAPVSQPLQGGPITRVPPTPQENVDPPPNTRVPTLQGK
eukprot:14937736-Ditylum_brightwellii.AAC.1